MENWTIESLAAALRKKQVSIVEVAQQYVDRIMEEDVALTNAVITLNPFWKEEAARLQENLYQDSPVLHGIPILIKDNIDTINLGNSAGSIALRDVAVDANAPLVDALLKQGALILGKSNLSEWANFRSTNSTSGWSSLGGQTKNARAPEFSPSGSSSGSAAGVAANFCVAAIGTETDGSIVSPAAHNGIIGLKPQVGRVSRTGIIPIAWSQDTAGPMTKTVTDSALLLNCLHSEDEADAATLNQPEQPFKFDQFCYREFIQGKRIGYLSPNEQFPSEVSVEFFKVIENLMAAGAHCIEVDPLPSMLTLQDHEITQMCCEFPEALEQYFAKRRTTSPYKNLADLHAFNQNNFNDVMSKFRQEWFDKCLTMPGTDSALYQQAQQAIGHYRDELQSLWFKEHSLDAIVCAANGPSWRINPIANDKYTGGNSQLAAVAGCPSISVPFTEVDSLPLGALFIGKPWQEAKLLGIAYGFEQALKTE